MNPLSRVNELDIKTQEIKERASVPCREGLIMGVEASVLYHLQPDRAADVFRKIGTAYAEVLLIPNFRSAIRARDRRKHRGVALLRRARERSPGRS